MTVVAGITFTVANPHWEKIDPNLCGKKDVRIARIVLESGDWLSVSKYEDEDFWTIDSMWRNGNFPVECHGTGSRLRSVLQSLHSEIGEHLETVDFGEKATF